MKLSFTLTCDCKNEKSYNAEEKYHSESHDTFIDLTEEICDYNFKAEPMPDGMKVTCGKCGKRTDII